MEMLFAQKLLNQDLRPCTKTYYRLDRVVIITEGKNGELAPLHPCLAYLARHWEPHLSFLVDSDGPNVVCLSHTIPHPQEKIAFAAYEITQQHFRHTSAMLGGKITVGMNDREALETIYPDEYYLKRIAEINRYQWGGIVEKLEHLR